VKNKILPPPAGMRGNLVLTAEAGRSGPVNDARDLGFDQNSQFAPTS
jgi:hypothetical protein